MTEIASPPFLQAGDLLAALCLGPEPGAGQRLAVGPYRGRVGFDAVGVQAVGDADLAERPWPAAEPFECLKDVTRCGAFFACRRPSIPRSEPSSWLEPAGPQDVRGETP
ncbi:hypothetical protein [Streptomyces sp. NPDC013455]|uniref:hypothetical protein n=1 Tax=Streptomyces sp. NPDC013455 TaxID=3155605 RepID=UPI0033F12BE8